MLIAGEWLLCDDDVRRPVIRGEVLATDGTWVPAEFLVDTGADRTVFSSALLTILAEGPAAADERLFGLGGPARCIAVETQIRLFQENGTLTMFRGRFLACPEASALDMSVLGRDVTGLFAAIIDEPASVVLLVRERHRYRVEHD